MSGAYEAFQREATEEKAGTLGLAGIRLEAALAELRAVDADPDRRGDREGLVWQLAELTMNLIVQREACGLRRSTDYVLKFYSLPREVALRLGARPPRPARRDREPAYFARR
jgi:hypothetical protein